MTHEQLLTHLAAACATAGGQSAWAKANGIGAPYVSEVLRGTRLPGPAFQKALGVERVEFYREIRK